MLIWNKGIDHVDLGAYEINLCQNCNARHNFNLILQYKYEGIWWCGRIYEKEYLSLCESCEKGYKLDKKEIEKTHKNIPIPFIRKYGFLTLISIAALLGIISNLK